MDARYCPKWYLESAGMQPFSARPAPGQHPPGSGSADWVRLAYLTPPNWLRFAQFAPRPTPRWPRPSRPRRKLGSFGAIRPNDNSVRDSLRPACRTPPRCPASAIGFVCTTPTPLVPHVPSHPRRIGFVFPRPLVGAIHHNSFSPKHLPFVSLEGKLGLFGAISAREGPASEVPRPVPTWARIGRLGSFCIIGSRQLGLLPERHRATRRCRTIGPPAPGLSPIRNPTTPRKADAGCPVPFRKSAIERLALFRTIGPRPPLTSNIKLHTSDFSYLYVSPYYAPCCRNLSGKMGCATR